MTFTRIDKRILLLNGLVPLAILVWDKTHNQLGPNPANSAIHSTGMVALICLVLSLCVTPAARLSGENSLILFRRTLGLLAFFYASLHLLIFYAWDRGMNLSSTISEMVKRPYLIVGSIALFIMVPLAATSFDAAIHWLGARRWKMLHRLVYIAALTAAIHYALQGKRITRLPIAFMLAVLALLAFRAVWAIASRQRLLAKRERTIAGNNVAGLPAPPKVPGRLWQGELRLAAIVDESADVRTFRLTPLEGSVLPFDYLPGQYLNLSLEIDGKTIKRSYTLSSSPTRRDACEITVKRDGIASTHLHDNMRLGDHLRVAAPAGRFTFTGAEAQRLLLIGGGVGITPLMSKIRYLCETNWPGEIHLIYSARTQADLVFREELDRLAKSRTNLHILYTLTRDEGGDWPGARGRVTRELLLNHAPEARLSAVHICGPDAMADAVRALLGEIGVPGEQIFFESFTPATRTPATVNLTNDQLAQKMESPRNGASKYELRFARSQQSMMVAKDLTVLEAAESLGIDIPYDCRSGICGQCKTAMLSGRVTMEMEDALNAADRAAGCILACQARCVEDVTVDA